MARSTLFSTLKGDPGRVSLKSVLQKLDKLQQIQALQLPDDLFGALPPQILRTYQRRVAAEPPREVRQHPEATRYMLPPLLDALEFRANAATHRPVLQALTLLKAQRDSRQRDFLVDGSIPIAGIIPAQ